MPYVSEDFYLNTYYGKTAGSEFNRLAKRASDDIDIACLHSVVLADLDENELLMLENATCAQIEYYVVNGDEYNESDRVGSESIGGFSSQVNPSQQRSPASLCPRALAYLEQIGLMCRAAKVLR